MSSSQSKSQSNQAILGAKRSLKTVLRILSIGWSTEARMLSDLQSLGVRSSGILMVHSSLSSLGNVSGGSVSVIKVIREALGPKGTLIMPAHSWDVMEEGCRIFNARNTKSGVGVITETFRNMPGVHRSLHPSHSIAAAGPLAAELIADHEMCPTPCGAGTPYEKLCRMKGQVLFLGTTLDSNTAYHTIEAMADLSYLMKPSADTFTIVDQEGQKRKLAVWRHEAGISRRFAEWENLLVQQEILKVGKVGKARTLLMEGAAFLEFMLDRVSKEPRMLLR
jgi:aminoglycoside 3-N-acetyltransferase